ncbi:MAG: AMP-binding protein [Acidobacteriia bacterium]|nr:AMP-binding protein [Terriglobia bacterium]
MPIRMQSFYQLFLDAVARWPQNIAVEMRHSQAAPGRPEIEQFTYAELRRMAESVGRWLAEAGAIRGERVAILAANGPRWVAAYLGVMSSGGIAVPLDTAFTAQQVEKLLKDSGSRYIFCDQRHFHIAEEAAARIGVGILLLEPVSGRQFPTLDVMFASGPGNFTPAGVGPEDLAVLLYTSGTTADPKGVVLTHDNLVAEVDAVVRTLELGPTDAILGVLPLFHALAQMANLLLPFSFGAKVIYLESLNVTDLLRALREGGATLFCCVPQFFYLIHERIMKEVQARGALARIAVRAMMRVSRLLHPFGINAGKLFFRRAHEALGPRMRYLITGGSRFDPAIGLDLQAMGFEILQAYGLTETSGGAFLTRPQHNVVGSVGQALWGVEGKILDPQPSGEGGPADGEICVRGRLVMKGYWNRPDATEQVIREGWLHTGDLGFFDEQKNLHITGRKKDVIVLSSGKNIYPEELEAHYAQSPWIKEICVIGLESAPGEPFAERLHAVVVPDFELLKQKRIVNVNEVIRFDIDTLSVQLPSTKRILSYEIWRGELPRTTTRKLKRYAIQKRVQELTARRDAPALAARELTRDEIDWLQDSDVQRAMALIRRTSNSGGRELRPADNLELDLGLDSMERVELLVALEKELGAQVEDSVVSEVYTVRELVDAVRAGIGSTSTRGGFAGWDAVFATESDDPEVLAIVEPHRLQTLAWFLFGRLVNLVARDSFSLKVTGLEKLPPRGPYIISPNHQSYLDAPVLVSLVPWSIYRELFFVGTSEIFGDGLLRRLARSIKLIPVDPDSNLVPAMRAGAFGLRRGRILVLFPEGERSIDGTPRTFKKGAAILSTHLNVPIYPVAVAGFHEAWPRGRSFQSFSRLRIAIGDPILPAPGRQHDEKVYEELTRELKERVMRMWVEIAGVPAPAEELAAD